MLWAVAQKAERKEQRKKDFLSAIGGVTIILELIVRRYERLLRLNEYELLTEHIVRIFSLQEASSSAMKESVKLL